MIDGVTHSAKPATHDGVELPLNEEPTGVALVMMVRNELEMLRTNLLYHRFLGVDRMFLYDDGSDDGTLESVADLPYVVARPTVQPSELEPSPELTKAIEQRSSQIVARQVLNMAHAMVEARRAGASWLIGFDADELIVLDHHNAAPNSVAKLLHAQPRSIEAVVFPALEVVQRRLAYTDVMVEETLFKRADVPMNRDTYDPFSNSVRPIDFLYGHRFGKMAVRLDIEAVPRSSHRWVRRGRVGLQTRRAGNLLHYYAPDYDTFVRKFRIMTDHPDLHFSGRQVSDQKRLWREVVNRSGLSDGELRDYYARWVMFDDAQVSRLMAGRRRLLRSRPAVVEVTSARDTILALRSAAQSSGRAAA